VGGTGLLGGLSPDRRGALIYVLASLVFILTDSLAKVIVADVPIVPVVLGRNIAYVVAVVVLLGGRSPRRLLRTARPRTQLSRGLLMFASTATYFWALSLLPLAEVSALSSTSPLITLALAGPLLGERVTRGAVLGAAIGFGGVLLLVGVDPARLDLAVVVPLGNAAILALFYLLTRDLRDEPPAVTMFWSGAIPLAASALLFAAVPFERPPTPAEWLGIATVGLLALTAHRLLVGAYRWGRASDLAPMGYLGVLWAFVVGALVFAEPLTPQSIAGAIAIAAGGIVVLRAPAPRDELAPALGDYAVPIIEADEAGPFERSADAPVAVDPPQAPAQRPSPARYRRLSR
jgi:S-adenosylmethionine uptake transporter